MQFASFNPLHFIVEKSIVEALMNGEVADILGIKSRLILLGWWERLHLLLLDIMILEK